MTALSKWNLMEILASSSGSTFISDSGTTGVNMSGVCLSQPSVPQDMKALHGSGAFTFRAQENKMMTENSIVSLYILLVFLGV